MQSCYVTACHRVTTALILQTGKRGSNRLFDSPLSVCCLYVSEGSRMKVSPLTQKTSSSWSLFSGNVQQDMCLLQTDKKFLDEKVSSPKSLETGLESIAIRILQKCPQIVSGNRDENLIYFYLAAHYDHRLHRKQPWLLQSKLVSRQAALRVSVNNPT